MNANVKGMYPLYDTVRMAEAAMQELLKLKAKVAKFQAAEAERATTSGTQRKIRPRRTHPIPGAE